MPSTWQSTPGEDFVCPHHCRAVYSVTITRYPAREREKAVCDVCGKVMNEWNTTRSQSYTLNRRPDDRGTD
jgi:hypothetical protein